MPNRYSTKEGLKALDIARKSVNLWVLKREKYVPLRYPKKFDEKAGVFVTLHTYPDHKLRGCIGYPEPFMPLIRSLISSACHAAEDPRFDNLSEKELLNILVEVSLLTKPERLEFKKGPEELLKRIQIGKHGLIVRKWSLSGLLLPQVATEHGFSARAFLEHTCMKASLPTDAWQDVGTSVYRFESRVFSEEQPPIRIEVD